jgi:conjugal transfer/entry exclusion protein
MTVQFFYNLPQTLGVKKRMQQVQARFPQPDPPTGRQQLSGRKRQRSAAEEDHNHEADVIEVAPDADARGEQERKKAMDRVAERVEDLQRKLASVQSTADSLKKELTTWIEA